MPSFNWLRGGAGTCALEREELANPARAHSGDRDPERNGRDVRDALNESEDKDVGAGGHDGGAIQNAVPNQQILRRAGTYAQGAGGQDHPGRVQGGAGRAQGGGGARAALHLVSDGVQRPLRGPGRDLAVRVRGGAIPKSDGSV